MIRDLVQTVVAKNKKMNGDPPKYRVDLIVSSNGMLDFLNAWQYLNKATPKVEDQLYIYWVAPMDDHVDPLYLGDAGAMAYSAGMRTLFPCATEPVVGIDECFFPVGGSFEYLNGEFELHFNSSRWQYNTSTSKYELVPYVYKKEDFEPRLWYNGAYYTQVQQRDIVINSITFVNDYFSSAEYA